jgi:hypothetical protein
MYSWDFLYSQGSAIMKTEKQLIRELPFFDQFHVELPDVYTIVFSCCPMTVCQDESYPLLNRPDALTLFLVFVPKNDEVTRE